jgi:hypothetical protein
MELEDEELQSANYRDHPPQAVDEIQAKTRDRAIDAHRVALSLSLKCCHLSRY